MTEEEEIIQYLESIGAHEITQEEKKQSWYKEHLKQLERWRKEEVGKPFTVREKRYLYGTSPQRSSKSKV